MSHLNLQFGLFTLLDARNLSSLGRLAASKRDPSFATAPDVEAIATRRSFR